MPQSFAFLLLPGISALGFIATLEPLRVANRFARAATAGASLGREGAAVTASNGMSVNVDSGLDALEAGTTLFVVAGFEPLAHYDDASPAGCARSPATAIPWAGSTPVPWCWPVPGCWTAIGSPCTGRRWRPFASEAWPQLEVTGELFEIDRGRITCAGGTASLDLLLELIVRSHGSELCGAGLRAIRARAHSPAARAPAAAVGAALRHRQSQADPRGGAHGAPHRDAPGHPGTAAGIQ